MPRVKAPYRRKTEDFAFNQKKVDAHHARDPYPLIKTPHMSAGIHDMYNVRTRHWETRAGDLLEFPPDFMTY